MDKIDALIERIEKIADDIEKRGLEIASKS